MLVIMVTPAKQLATYQDVLDAPEHLVAEILHGALYTQPRPAPRHAHAASLLGASLIDPFGRGRGGPGGWLILDEPELHLGGHVLVPDLAGWRRERMPRLPETAWFEQAPDWICEILSPSTAGKDRAIKLPIFGTTGVPFAWLIDPVAATLEAFEHLEDRWTLVGTWERGATARIPPFEATALALDDFLAAD